MLAKIPLRKYPELDSLRFLSIFLVVCHHQFLDQNALLNWTKKYAWVGVDIFFVLSGFIITSLLIKEYEVFQKINLKKFWLKRMLRLWPAWLLVLILSTAMVYFYSRNNPELRSALYHKGWHYYFHFGNYSHGYWGKLHTLFSHYWSLAIEEHFYIVWPIVLLWVLQRRKYLNIVFGFLLVLPLLFRLYHGANGADYAYIKLSTHTRFDELIAGCLLAINFNKLKDLNFTRELVLTFLMILCFFTGLHLMDDTSAPWYISSFNFTLISIGSVLLILIAMKGTSFGLRRILQNSLMSKIGILSYNIYLIHFMVISITFGFLARYPLTNNHMLIMPGIFLMTIPPAYIMYLLIDSRIEKIKNSIK